jgi:superfamily II DNA/RNA helicase
LCTWTSSDFGVRKLSVSFVRFRAALPTHIVVATPGRLIDLIQRKTINKRLNSRAR